MSRTAHLTLAKKVPTTEVIDSRTPREFCVKITHTDSARTRKLCCPFAKSVKNARVCAFLGTRPSLCTTFSYAFSATSPSLALNHCMSSEGWNCWDFTFSVMVNFKHSGKFFAFARLIINSTVRTINTYREGEAGWPELLKVNRVDSCTSCSSSNIHMPSIQLDSV